MRTVLIPWSPEPRVLRALYDVRSAVNTLAADWRANPANRFAATKRSYPLLRQRYAHLASSWAVTMCNEASATLNAWKSSLRRWQRIDPARAAKMEQCGPRRTRFKASLHWKLFRLKGRTLSITVAPRRHATLDLSGVRNPLFERYLAASGGKFGLAVTDRFLVFNFHVENAQPVRPHTAGVDLNMKSDDMVTTDGTASSVDISGIARIQMAMRKKREKVQRALRHDLRQQRRVLRRMARREHRRVGGRLHLAVNEMLAKTGDRNLAFEDLTGARERLMAKRRGPEQRHRLSAWVYAEFQRIASYKSKSAVVRVNPKGTSQECPRCGAALRHPSWRRATCANCKGDWNRDLTAAINIATRGQSTLRGETPPPSALNALLEAARWRPETGPTGGPMTGDEAKLPGGVGFI